MPILNAYSDARNQILGQLNAFKEAGALYVSLPAAAHDIVRYDLTKNEDGYALGTMPVYSYLNLQFNLCYVEMPNDEGAGQSLAVDYTQTSLSDWQRTALKRAVDMVKQAKWRLKCPEPTIDHDQCFIEFKNGEGISFFQLLEQAIVAYNWQDKGRELVIAEAATELNNGCPRGGAWMTLGGDPDIWRYLAWQPNGNNIAVVCPLLSIYMMYLDRTSVKYEMQDGFQLPNLESVEIQTRLMFAALSQLLIEE